MSAVEKGSLILVTGANGFIASHIVDQLLKAGMKARGAVRSEEKAAWLEEYVNSTYGQDQLQIVVVPDTSIPSAYDEAVKGASEWLWFRFRSDSNAGCSGVVHVAAIMTFDPDPNVVVGGTVASVETCSLLQQRNPRCGASYTALHLWLSVGQCQT